MGELTDDTPLNFTIGTSNPTEVDLILQSMDTLRVQRREVRLFSFFKGLPVIYPAQVVDVGIETVRFLIHRYQVFSLGLLKDAYFKSETFPKIVHGYLKAIDTERQIAVFSGFAYVDSSPDQRTAVRVEPKTPIMVGIRVGEAEILGLLSDICPSAVAISTTDPGFLTPLMTVEAHFQLPTSNPHVFHAINVSGRVYRIFRTGNRHRVVIVMSPGPHVEHRISQYIFFRQTEIVRELKEFTGF